MATVTMDQTEHEALKGAIEAARQETLKVKKQLEEERERSYDDRLADLTKFSTAAKEVVDFAVANLSPEFSRGWPVDAMGILATNVDKIGNPSSRDGERAIIWRQFQENVIDFDRRWALASMTSGTVAEAMAAVAPQIVVQRPGLRFWVMMLVVAILILVAGATIGARI